MKANFVQDTQNSMKNPDVLVGRMLSIGQKSLRTWVDASEKKLLCIIWYLVAILRLGVGEVSKLTWLLLLTTRCGTILFYPAC